MILRRLIPLALVLMTALPALAQLGPVPLAGLSVIPAGTSTARSLANRLSDRLSVLDFGAVCDGVTNDTTAIQAAAASGKPVSVPAGKVCNAPGVAQGLPFGLFTGPGKIEDGSGSLRGPQAGGVTVNPNPASWNSATNLADNCVDGLNCWAKFDYSHALTAEEFTIADSNGGHTLGQPVHGYEYMPGAYPHNAYFTNKSGWNNSLTGNDGRTGSVYNHIVAQQSGAGDMMVNEAEILCGGNVQTGTTDWLAVPSCAWEAGDITALTNSQYLQHSEWHFSDNGNDVAAIGRVMGYNRTATTSNLNNRWVNDLAACTGTVACDAAYEVTGKWRIGLDFTEISTQITAAVAMIAGQKITLNGAWVDGEGNPGKTNLGTDWITDDGSNVVLAQNNAAVLKLNNPAAAVNDWKLQGAPAGGYLYLSAEGADSAIPIVFQDKGGGGVDFVSNGSVVLNASAAAASTGYAQLSAASSGQPVILQVVSAVSTDLYLLASGGNGTVHLGGKVRLDMSTPASSSAACVPGQMTFDANYHYDCVATNTWKRMALSSW